MDGLMLRGACRITVRLVWLLLPVVGLLAAAPVASATVAPRLVVTAVKSPPSRLAILSVFRVRDTTRDEGGGRAPASLTAYLLSADRRPSVNDLSVGDRRVPALARGKSSSGQVRLRVPVLAAGGRFYLLACASAGRPVPRCGAEPRRAG